MNNKISQELKWKEEFESHFKGIFNFKESPICPWEYRDDSTMDAWGVYLAARKKAQEEIDKYKSLYESVEIERKRYHREFCQERQRVIDSKPTIRAQKEIADLKKRNEALKYSHDMVSEMNTEKLFVIEDMDKKIEKRDKLLEISKEAVERYLSWDSDNPIEFEKWSQWLKDVEELYG